MPNQYPELNSPKEKMLRKVQYLATFWEIGANVKNFRRATFSVQGFPAAHIGTSHTLFHTRTCKNKCEFKITFALLCYLVTTMHENLELG